MLGDVVVKIFQKMIGQIIPEIKNGLASSFLFEEFEEFAVGWDKFRAGNHF
jgi:hypothetical protein